MALGEGPWPDLCWTNQSPGALSLFLASMLTVPPVWEALPAPHLCLDNLLVVI